MLHSGLVAARDRLLVLHKEKVAALGDFLAQSSPLCDDVAQMVAEYACGGMVQTKLSNGAETKTAPQFHSDGRHWWTLCKDRVWSTHFSGCVPLSWTPLRAEDGGSFLATLEDGSLLVTYAGYLDDYLRCDVVGTTGRVLCTWRVPLFPSFVYLQHQSVVLAADGSDELALHHSNGSLHWLVFFNAKTGDRLREYPLSDDQTANNFAHLPSRDLIVCERPWSASVAVLTRSPLREDRLVEWQVPREARDHTLILHSRTACFFLPLSKSLVLYDLMTGQRSESQDVDLDCVEGSSSLSRPVTDKKTGITFFVQGTVLHAVWP